MTKEQFFAIATPRTDACWRRTGGDGGVAAGILILTLAAQLERELFIANEWNKKAHEKARRQAKEGK